ncbi:MAG: ribosomal-processing cysteine protease Prp [Bavariicoccus seileri]|uniref:Ribosomal processing cysteine protease Prp n=1 Tax=Bavariicoccus seileri TaxID=549685 RepID=A0A3D4S483_9ENTE|nr:ribosomal-processing cysteine protease Prp [Bavariicoccus seileri]HCS93614.1 ribosomal-processing cysteine protease Prp [Bavariicoccus seileri]
MITCHFVREDGLFLGFTCKGHADFSEYGSDIVCAAVSALTLSTVNSLESIGKVVPQVESAADDGGYLKVRLPDSNTLSKKQLDVCQILMQHLYLGLVSISEEYQAYISVLD